MVFIFTNTSSRHKHYCPPQVINLEVDTSLCRGFLEFRHAQPPVWGADGSRVPYIPIPLTRKHLLRSSVKTASTIVCEVIFGLVTIYDQVHFLSLIFPSHYFFASFVQNYYFSGVKISATRVSSLEDNISGHKESFYFPRFDYASCVVITFNPFVGGGPQ